MSDDLRTRLLALADRCEREEPSRNLDWAIGDITKSPLHGFFMPTFSSSLDAAVTLMGERGWGLTWDIKSVHAGGIGLPANIGVCAYVWTGHMTNKSTFRRSPPVATFSEATKWLPRLICAAALRARAAVQS